LQGQIETKNERATLLTQLQAVEYRIFSYLFWGGRNALSMPCPIAGTGVFFRRSILERVAGWDNELVEDYDLYCKLVVAKARIEYKPDIVALDEKPRSLKLLLSQRRRSQRGHTEPSGEPAEWSSGDARRPQGTQTSGSVAPACSVVAATGPPS